MHPLCAMCEEDGNLRPGTEVDHKVKHDGNTTLFYDPGNLQTLCSDHHRSTKARAERSGKQTGCDLHGNPKRAAHW
jgi:5-methylcytosine-specific restriction endonuclease McrA